MCGLWGVVAKDRLTKEHLTLFQELGLISTLRGYDSSGVALALRTKKKGFHYNWYKDVIPACNLVWEPQIADFFAKAKCPLVLMGHARWATVGAVKMDNAHPFRTGNLLGMHNGTIPFLKDKDRTDSEVLYESIGKKGLELTLQSIEGQKAYALTWFDLSDGTFNVIRNYDRTLFFMYSADKKIMVYASDDAFLKLIDARYPTMNFGFAQPFEMNHHYKFKHGETIPTKERVRDFVPFTTGLPALTDQRWRSPGNAEKREMMENLQSPTNSGSTTADTTTGKNTTVIQLPESAAGNRAVLELLNQKPILFPDTQGSDYMSLDRPAQLFRSKIIILPMRITVNKVIKHLRYKMFDGSYADPVSATRLLEKGCAYTGQVAGIKDNVVWVSPDTYVLKEHADIPFVTEALAAYGHTSHIDGEPFYISLPRMSQLRKQHAGLPF